MTDRQAFEAWATSADSPIEAGMPWESDVVRDMWAAWQAATAAERGRCAKVCEGKGKWLNDALGAYRPIVAKHSCAAARMCAEAIRKG